MPFMGGMPTQDELMAIIAARAAQAQAPGGQYAPPAMPPPETVAGQYGDPSLPQSAGAVPPPDAGAGQYGAPTMAPFQGPVSPGPRSQDAFGPPPDLPNITQPVHPYIPPGYGEAWGLRGALSGHVERDKDIAKQIDQYNKDLLEYDKKLGDYNRSYKRWLDTGEMREREARVGAADELAKRRETTPQPRMTGDLGNLQQLYPNASPEELLAMETKRRASERAPREPTEFERKVKFLTDAGYSPKEIADRLAGGRVAGTPKVPGQILKGFIENRTTQPAITDVNGKPTVDTDAVSADIADWTEKMAAQAGGQSGAPAGGSSQPVQMKDGTRWQKKNGKWVKLS